MKMPIILSLAILAIAAGCSNDSKPVDANIIESSATANNPNAKGSMPVITFENTTFDFKSLTEGESVEHLYHFKNTGTKALLIAEVKTECGCTVPDWPREPILPGQEADIKIVFNSSNKDGSINKHATIIANTDPVETKLSFTAFVKKKPEGK